MKNFLLLEMTTVYLTCGLVFATYPYRYRHISLATRVAVVFAWPVFVTVASSETIDAMARKDVG